MKSYEVTHHMINLKQVSLYSKGQHTRIYYQQTNSHGNNYLVIIHVHNKQ